MVRKKAAIAGGIAAIAALAPSTAAGQAFDEMRTDASTFEERYLKTYVPPAQSTSASDSQMTLDAATQALEGADATVTADEVASALEQARDVLAGTSFAVTAEQLRGALAEASDVAADQDGAVTSDQAADAIRDSATSQQGIAHALQRILSDEPQDEMLRDEGELRPSGVEQILEARDANEARNEIEEALRARLGTEENEIDALLDDVLGQDEPAFAPWTGAAPEVTGGGS